MKRRDFFKRIGAGVSAAAVGSIFTSLAEAFPTAKQAADGFNKAAGKLEQNVPALHDGQVSYTEIKQDEIDVTSPLTHDLLTDPYIKEWQIVRNTDIIELVTTDGKYHDPIVGRIKDEFYLCCITEKMDLFELGKIAVITLGLGKYRVLIRDVTYRSAIGFITETMEDGLIEIIGGTNRPDEIYIVQGQILNQAVIEAVCEVKHG